MHPTPGGGWPEVEWDSGCNFGIKGESSIPIQWSSPLNRDCLVTIISCIKELYGL